MPDSSPFDPNEEFREAPTPAPGCQACEPWEAAIALSADDALPAEMEAPLTRHLEGCAHCRAILQASGEGVRWLALLEREPPVPDGLFEKILVRTELRTGSRTGGSNPLIQSLGSREPLIPSIFLPDRTGPPRSHWLLTAAMAIFSIAFTLQLAGYRVPRPGATGAFGLAAPYRSASGLVAGYYKSFSRAQAAAVSQIRAVLEDLKAAKQIGTIPVADQRKML